MKKFKQLNVELPDDILMKLDIEHQKTGKSKKRLVKDALEGIFGSGK